MAYQSTPPTGSQESAALAWASTMSDFVAGRLASLTTIAFRSNCNTLAAEIEPRTAVSVTGTAGLFKATGSNFLRLRLTSGTNANAYRQVCNRNLAVNAGASTFGNLVANCRTSVYAVAVRGVVRAVNNTCLLIMANITDETTADAFLGVNGATSQTTFSLKVGAAAAVDTLVPVGTLGVTEHDLVIIGDGTNISAYIDLNTTAAAVSLQNAAANAAGHTNTYALNGATATNVSHDILQWAVFTVA